MKAWTFFLLLAAAAAPLAAQSRPEQLHQLFDEYYQHRLRSSPETATYVGVTDYDHLWSDLSRAGREKTAQEKRGFLERLAAFPPGDPGEQDQISLDLMRAEIEDELAGAEIEQHLLGFNQLFGYHTAVMLTMRQMPLRTVKHYENYIARLRGLDAYAGQVIELLSDAIERGLVQPRFVAETIAQQLETQAKPGADEAPLLEPFRSIARSIPEGERERLKAEAAAVYGEVFQPAWARMRDFVVDSYLPKTRPEIAATTLPQGSEWYAYLVKHFTTTALTPDEIHEIGLGEVARIQSAMDAIAKEAGFDDAGSYEEHLTTSPGELFKSKDDMLVYCRNIAKIVDPELPKMFKLLPRMPFGIRPIPEDREAASASNYSAPAADGSRAGWFNLKAYKPEEQAKFDIPALVLHETNPGHHLQIALQMEIEGLPEFRKIYSVTSYIEGWALYAESLGEELGAYSEPSTRFGQLASERFRARRLVVDTGLHTKGWTREQAVEYLGDASEVDRYIAWPGQALAYKIGQLKIMELREKASQAVGENFDIRDFHDVVLRNGPLPLDLLEKQVDAYIND